MSCNKFNKDLIIALLTVIPAWIIQTVLYNTLATNSRVYVEPIRNFLVAYPHNPFSPGIFLMLGIFTLGLMVILSAFRGILPTRGGNLIKVFIHGSKKVTKKMRLKSFLAWIGLMPIYSLLVGMMMGWESFLFSAFMPNHLVTDVDFNIRFNTAFIVAMALIGVVSTMVQQVLEKSCRSFSKSILITALVLLSFYMGISPRPI
ncbi:MAG: hypothetical protein ACTSXP_19200 [Promethearchaeota archaeon]